MKNLTEIEKFVNNLPSKVLKEFKDAIVKRYYKESLSALNEEERVLVDNNQIIPAIKAYRTRTGFDLADSKNAIDYYRQERKDIAKIKDK